ncbi:MAG: OsmC family protein [Planctomycetes bacterium]|nr:OsmC family protein [Planctomycetota bacterium]
MHYQAAARVAPGGEGYIDTQQSRIQFDGSAGSGDALPGPAHLLAASLCACMLKNVERMSGLLKFKYRAASIEVDATRDEPPPRIAGLRYTLRVETEESEKRLSLLHRNILKHGTITNTLAAACDVQGELVGVRQDGTIMKSTRD